MSEFIYFYKRVNSGKFTSWIISITASGNVVVEHRFKGKRKSQELFENPKAINTSSLPKNIKEVALWAKFEAKV